MKALNKISVLAIVAILVAISCKKKFDVESESKLYSEVVSNNEVYESSEQIQSETNFASKKIQVALLLDTSGSMSGLIEQAKSRLWDIVNTLTTLKFDGKEPQIEISLYEYGNDGIRNENWVRQLTPLTQDLDLVSEKLFALHTNGGTEYCGAVINNASKELKWDSDNTSMKLIYIAGNEPFNQQGINYKEAISFAKGKEIYINTIFCGNKQEGINTFWKDGADIGLGKYFNIDHNHKVISIPTPYDDKIDFCNTKLNDTYVSYGSLGYSKKQNQIRQDQQAEKISYENKAKRAISKTKANAYNNASWDLVDKAKEDENFYKDLKDKDLPEELKGKSETEIKAYVEQKAKERKEIQQEISDLAKQRLAYIDEYKKNNSETVGDDLGKAIEKSVLEIAGKKGYKAEL